jgi:hypothetical protein
MRPSKRKRPDKGTRILEPDVIFHKGRPVGVILGIGDYQWLIDRVEDKHDLELLAKLRNQPRPYRDFQACLEERKPKLAKGKSR